MQQIADWLEKLGMSEYAQRFAENATRRSLCCCGAGSVRGRATGSWS